MNTWERMKRTYEHKEADRVPIVDGPWAGTLRRWRREGLPSDMLWQDYFGVDKVRLIQVDVTPRYEQKIVEETDRYVIFTTGWGVTMKQFKEQDSTPDYLDYKVTTAEEWEKAKARLTLEDDRIPWEQLKRDFPKWREEGSWIRARFVFGFDRTHSEIMGMTNTLIAMLEEPELVEDMFDTMLNRCIALYDRIWDAGYHFDEIHWADDLGYKGTSFFSPELYRQMLQPYHKRAVDWAHNHGIYARLHSCGNIMGLLPDIVATGIDSLNPMEVKAGMDPLKIKREYGDRLVLHGGFNAATMCKPDIILPEIREKLPLLMENSGYIFATDHTIPNDVSLETMRAIVEEVKRVGRY